MSIHVKLKTTSRMARIEKELEKDFVEKVELTVYGGQAFEMDKMLEIVKRDDLSVNELMAEIFYAGMIRYSFEKRSAGSPESRAFQAGINAGNAISGFDFNSLTTPKSRYVTFEVCGEQARQLRMMVTIADSFGISRDELMQELYTYGVRAVKEYFQQMMNEHGNPEDNPASLAPSMLN